MNDAERQPIRIVLTPGEPAGIGPEITRALVTDPFENAEITVVADASLVGLVDHGAAPGTILPLAPGWQVLHQPVREPVVPGKPDPANANYVVGTLDTAVDGCLDGTFDALVTGPVQKSVIAATGRRFSGHTEYLAERCHAPLPVMLLTDGELHVALATTHLPLSAVPGAVTGERLAATLNVLAADLTNKFGITRPRILVCGLNPHAGEDGLLGHEDRQIIAPAVAAARERGINAIGPVPADTAFTPNALKDADAVLAMYHDQGLPVIKARGFGGIANVTLGLPIVRSSVDHGTALDLAGTGTASPDSLVTAIHTAISLVRATQGAVLAA